MNTPHFSNDADFQDRFNGGFNGHFNGGSQSGPEGRRLGRGRRGFQAQGEMPGDPRNGEFVRRQRGRRGDGPEQGRPVGRGRGGFGGHASHGGWGGPPPWEWAGGPRGRGRGPRVRRGDVRVAILDVLAAADGELNGYQVIQAIVEKTDGAWKPSPGSVYPTISQLEDEGLVVVSTETGKKVISLTEAGRTWADDNADERNAVWSAFDDIEGTDVRALKQVLKQTMGAVGQVFAAGTPAQQAQAVTILDETRRKLYGLLAEGPAD